MKSWRFGLADLPQRCCNDETFWHWDPFLIVCVIFSAGNQAYSIFTLLSCIRVEPWLIDVTPLPPSGCVSGPLPLSHVILHPLPVFPGLLIYLSEHNQELKNIIIDCSAIVLGPPNAQRWHRLIYGPWSAIRSHWNTLFHAFPDVKIENFQSSFRLKPLVKSAELLFEQIARTHGLCGLIKRSDRAPDGERGRTLEESELNRSYCWQLPRLCRPKPPPHIKSSGLDAHFPASPRCLCWKLLSHS